MNSGGMTLEEIIASDKAVLSANDVSKTMRMNTSRILEYARTGQLEHLQPIVSGRSVKIPRLRYLEWLGVKV